MASPACVGWRTKNRSAGGGVRCWVAIDSPSMWKNASLAAFSPHHSLRNFHREMTCLEVDRTPHDACFAQTLSRRGARAIFES